VRTAGSASANSANRGGGASASANTANRGGNTANTANRSGNATGNNVNSGNRTNNVNNSGNRNSGNNVNNGNINVGNDVNVNIDGGYNGCCGAVTIIRLPRPRQSVRSRDDGSSRRSTYYALPPSGCSTVVMNGATYSQCGSVYYQQTMQGSDPVYVVVNP
jgi:hypothetical protein